VPAKRSRKKVDLPDAGSPIKMTHSPMPTDIVSDWVSALEARHLKDLRVAEVTRALRALSSAYVERRHTVARGGALDSAGKRAAFALFYAPLHFLATLHVVQSLGAHEPSPSAILDIGCGTGAAGAAWAVAAGGTPAVTGIDRHPWAVDEARWTYRALGLRGTARQGDATRALPGFGSRVPNPESRLGTGGKAAIAGYVLNELPEPARLRVEDQLFSAAARGVRTLIVEPIARGIAPWWDETARRAADAGGRADEWRFEADLPPFVRLLDKAAGLSHRELTVRSIWLPGENTKSTKTD
jgi:SAM-dependent methyltransferase